MCRLANVLTGMLRCRTYRVHVSAHNVQEKDRSDAPPDAALRTSATLARDSAKGVARTAVVARMSGTVVRKFRHVVDEPFRGEPYRRGAPPGRCEGALERTAVLFRHCCARPGEVPTRFAAARTPRLAPPRWLSSRATAVRRTPDTPGSARSSTGGRLNDPLDRPCRSAQCYRNPPPACGRQHGWSRSAGRERDLHCAMPESLNVRRRWAPCTCHSNRALTESVRSAPLATTREKHSVPCNGVPDVAIDRPNGSHRLSSQRNDGSRSQTGLSSPERRHLARVTSGPCTEIGHWRAPQCSRDGFSSDLIYHRSRLEEGDARRTNIEAFHTPSVARSTARSRANASRRTIHRLPSVAVTCHIDSCSFHGVTSEAFASATVPRLRLFGRTNSSPFLGIPDCGIASPRQLARGSRCPRQHALSCWE
jgi:hypothetical protein